MFAQPDEHTRLLADRERLYATNDVEHNPTWDCGADTEEEVDVYVPGDSTSFQTVCPA